MGGTRVACNRASHPNVCKSGEALAWIRMWEGRTRGAPRSTGKGDPTTAAYFDACRKFCVISAHCDSVSNDGPGATSSPPSAAAMPS